MIKLFFYLVNLIFIVFYLYPGSILGKIIYGDFKKQPQLTPDFNFSILDISIGQIRLNINDLGFLFPKYRSNVFLHLHAGIFLTRFPATLEK